MKKQQNNKVLKLKELTKKLLDKYSNIIGNQYTENTTIEKIIEHIVKYYESMIHCMPGNVYWFDKNCIGVGCNKNVLDMFGFESLKEFAGLSFEEMGKIGNWPVDSTQSYKNDTLGVIKTGKPKTNVDELPLLHSDGRILYFLTNRVPLFDYAGDIVGVVGISFDITERRAKEKELREAKEQAEEALQAKDKAEKELRQKSKILNDILSELKEERYYLKGKYEGVFLTKREGQCIICIANGLTNKQTAKVLGVSFKTIELYVSNIKSKFGCDSRSELIAIAIQSDYLEGIRPAFLTNINENLVSS